MAEVMPVISEKNQQECVGGFYFVGGTGDYMAQSSYCGDQIRVITGNDLISYNAAVSGDYLDTYVGGYGLLYLNDSEKEEVYRGICGSGSASGFAGLQYYESDCYWDSSKPAIFMNGYNQVVFNTAHSLYTRSEVEAAWGTFLSGMDI